MDKSKLQSCISEFQSIPNKDYSFSIPGYIPHDYVIETIQAWEVLFPFKCLFAYNGEINKEMIEEINKLNKENGGSINLLPDLIMVNKKGIIRKELIEFKNNTPIFRYNFHNFDEKTPIGTPFSYILFHLFNHSNEEFLLRTKYENYFNSDVTNK